MNTSLVKVYDAKLKRMANRARVVLSIDGIFSGGMTKEVYTNDKGLAYMCSIRHLVCLLYILLGKK